MRKLIVPHSFSGKKLTSYLLCEYPNLSQNTIYKALRKKDIRINDVRISSNVLLSEGDCIILYIADKYLFESTFSLDVVFEDNNILVINKPKGIEVTGNNSLTTLVCNNFHNDSIIPCHRLDRNTKGLVLFAKNNTALEILLSKFKNNEITKFYRCKVWGLFNKKHDILDAFLFKDTKKSLVYISDTMKCGYRPIKTEYFVLEENKDKNYSILDIILHTGRTHQIRAHLAHIGHPIIGDRKIWNK